MCMFIKTFAHWYLAHAWVSTFLAVGATLFLVLLLPERVGNISSSLTSKLLDLFLGALLCPPKWQIVN